VACCFQELGVLDGLRWVGPGAADPASLGLGHHAGVRGPLGGEGALHLREQGDQQECDAAYALAGGVDGHRVSEGAHADAPFLQLVEKVEDLAQIAAL
jgi:hypothetical protein